MMDPGYYYSREGQRFGPVPGEQLKQLAAAGQLQPDDLIWKEGMANWIQASRVKGLFSTTAPQPPEITVAPLDPAPVGNAAASSNLPPVASSPRQDEPSDAARVARQAKDAALAASSDAIKAFKVLIKNPVGGLREAFETLGPTRAMNVGIVFAVLFDLCFLLAMRLFVAGVSGLLIAPSRMPGDLSFAPPSLSIGFGGYLKLAILGLVPIASGVGGFAAVRSMFRGRGGLQGDIFLAGASLLPIAVACLIVGVLGPGNFVIITLAILVFAFTTTVLMSYSGCTNLQGVPDAAATVAVPTMLLIDLYVCRIFMGWFF
jgi:hypothetical protein